MLIKTIFFSIVPSLGFAKPLNEATTDFVTLFPTTPYTTEEEGLIDMNGVYVIENQLWKGNLAFDPDSDHYYAGSHGRIDLLPNGTLLDNKQLFSFEYCNEKTGVKIKNYKNNKVLSMWHPWHNIYEDNDHIDSDSSQCFQLVPVIPSPNKNRFLIKSMHTGDAKGLVYRGMQVGPTFYNTPGNSLVGVPEDDPHKYWIEISDRPPWKDLWNSIQWNIRYIGEEADFPLDTKPTHDLNGFGGITGTFTIQNNHWKGNLAFDAGDHGRDHKLDILPESASINVNSTFKQDDHESQLFYFEECDMTIEVNNYSGDNLLVKIRSRRSKKSFSMWHKWHMKFEDGGDDDSSQCFELVPVRPSVKNRFLIKSMHKDSSDLFLQALHVGPTVFGAPGNSIIGVPDTNPRNNLWDSIQWNINFYRFEFDLPKPKP